MSIANEHADNFYFPHFEFKDFVNATYIMAFWDQTPCIRENTVFASLYGVYINYFMVAPVLECIDYIMEFSFHPTSSWKIPPYSLIDLLQKRQGW